MLRTPPSRPPTSLRLRIGNWFEAKASGWAAAMVPLVIALLLVGAALR